MKNKIIIGLIITVLIVSVVVLSGCIGGPSGVGDNENIGNLKITFNGVSIEDDFLFGKNQAVVFTFSNTGKEIEYMFGMYEYLYIQDPQGSVYRATSEHVTQGRWQDTLVPGETRVIKYYFPPDTPTTNVKLIFNINGEQAEFKL